MTIEGKTVLITGANGGIGQALVTEALSRGAARVYAGTRRLSGSLAGSWRDGAAKELERQNAALVRPPFGHGLTEGRTR